MSDRGILLSGFHMQDSVRRCERLPQMCPRIDAPQVDQIHNIGVCCVSVRIRLLYSGLGGIKRRSDP